MKRNLNTPHILILVLMFLFVKGYSQELIIDGNMEAYSGLSNFEYTGGGYTTLSDPLSGSSVAGNNAVTNNPKKFNTNFLSVADHSLGIIDGGQMLVVDGGTLGSGQYFWKAGYGGNGFCGLVIGKTYTFSYWVRSISSSVTNPATQADIRINFSNAEDITLVSGKTLAPLPSDGWEKVTYRFKAANYCVNINLWDNNTNSVGNDFALDDFSLLEGVPLSVTYSLSYGTQGIELFPYNVGANLSVASWSLKGPVTINNPLDFNHLVPGNYTLTGVGINGETASCDVVIAANPNMLTINGNTNICSGEEAVLTASGGNSVYQWYSFPTDESITDATSAVQTVNPKVSTNYTVKSSPALGNENLIYNGDFSMGNTGFGTLHKYYPTNFGNTPQAYSVVNDPHDWDPNFLSCGDHTTGNGNMMTINGADNVISTGPGMSTVWSQAVRVIGTTDYVFSFWLKSLSNENPAKLQVIINGSIYNITPFEGPANNTCGNWVKYSVNYFSGWVSDVAYIQLTNVTGTFIGNNFAIDDISLEAVTPVSYANHSITVDPSEKPILKTNLITENEIQINWDQLPQATGYEISYTINNAPSINVGIITANTYSVNGLNPGDSVKFVIKPIGSGCFEAAELTASTYLPCPVPAISVVNQPTCLKPLGSIKIDTPLGSEYEYSINGIDFQSDVLFADLTENDYLITVHNKITGCKSVSDLATINSPRAILPDIGASYSYQNCSLLLSAASSITNSTIVWNGPTLELNVPNPAKVSVSGKFTATVKDLNTGCDNSFSLDVIMPALPSTPKISTSSPTCSNAYGEIVVTSPLGTNYEYSVDGINYQSSVQFSNLIPKQYNVTARDVLTSCVSLPNPIFLSMPLIEKPGLLVNNDILCQNSVAEPLNAVALPGATLNWYGTFATGGTASNVPTIPSTSTLGVTTYYVSQTIGLCESERTPIEINVSGIGENPGFNDFVFCKGDTAPLLDPISPKGIKGTWEPSIIDNLESKSYHFTPIPNQCAVEQTINVSINSPTLKDVDWEVSQPFEDFQVIKVKVSEEGNYLYQLDNGILQNSPLFENVKQGYHMITVFDVNGCSDPISKDKVLVINLPKFFTPNGDNYNDFWDITNLKFHNEASVFIYDRYGKLLKQLFPAKDLGWDGTYQGKEMSSSDYWFVVTYIETNGRKEYRGHFSLKR